MSSNGLVGMDGRDGQRDDGIKAEPGGDLEFAIAPADGEQLAEGDQAKEEDGPQNGRDLLEEKQLSAQIGEGIGEQ